MIHRKYNIITTVNMRVLNGDIVIAYIEIGKKKKKFPQ